jgi:hypothetical protein
LDERRRSSPHHGSAERLDLAIDVQPASDARKQPIDGGQVQPSPDGPSQECSQTLVFYGDGQQVREGFAIALRAMEIVANDQPDDFVFPWGRPNREDS